ncbi:uncharacterized protein LOC143231021 [Tachypleus tridentatus]|uniref:uncharacterized protein LOC143231021 n=1 Tax=Tachypleus tridentatus TaxID=6853 RepID=UPI003FD57B61
MLINAPMDALEEFLVVSKERILEQIEAECECSDCEKSQKEMLRYGKETGSEIKNIWRTSWKKLKTENQRKNRRPFYSLPDVKKTRVKNGNTMVRKLGNKGKREEKINCNYILTDKKDEVPLSFLYIHREIVDNAFGLLLSPISSLRTVVSRAHKSLLSPARSLSGLCTKTLKQKLCYH